MINLDDKIVDSSGKYMLFIVENKLSKKPQKGADALKKFFDRNCYTLIHEPKVRYKLRQNYSNDMVEISKMYYRYNVDKFQTVAQKKILATSSVDKYLDAVDQLINSEPIQLSKNLKYYPYDEFEKSRILSEYCRRQDALFFRELVTAPITIIQNCFKSVSKFLKSKFNNKL